MRDALQEFERVLSYTKQELNVDLARSRGIAQLSLIRQRRITTRKNTTVLKTSYFVNLLRSTWRRSKVFQTKKVVCRTLNSDNISKLCAMFFF